MLKNINISQSWELKWYKFGNLNLTILGIKMVQVWEFV